MNFSGKWFHNVSYGVRQDDELIDYDEVERLAHEHKPKMIIAGATAYPRLIDFARFREIADAVGAKLMVDAAHFIGLVAGKAIPSPVPYADVVCFTTHKVLRGPRGGMILCKEELAAKIDKAVFPFSQGGPLMHAVAAKATALRECAQPAYQAYAAQVVSNAQALAEGLAAEGMRPVSGGTDTHLALIDLRETGVTGAEAEARCGAASITLNKNAIPYDPQPPMTASGIRVGTPAVTTQGMTEGDMKEVASLIARAVRDADGSAAAGSGGLGARARRAVPGLPCARRVLTRRAGSAAAVAVPGPGSVLARGAAPVREYAAVFAVAAAVTYLLTPLVQVLAVRIGAMAVPRDRDVHTLPTPRLGGVAMLGGIAVAMLVARSLPALQEAFTESDVGVVLLAGAIVCALGVVDDRFGLDAFTKLAGQILAAGVMTVLGVQLLYIFIPGLGGSSPSTTVVLSPGLGVPLTILLALVTVNAINFIDGLDGLAAGVMAIAALALFAFTYHLSEVQRVVVAAPPTLICAVLAGACVGLPAAQLQPGAHLHGRLRLHADRDHAGRRHHQRRRPGGLLRREHRHAPVPHPGRSSRPRCSWCPSPTSCWPWCGGRGRVARRSARTRCTCTTGCSSSATPRPARCSSCTCGRRCWPSARSPPR